VMSEKITVVVK